jgi:mRNA interferase MazF
VSARDDYPDDPGDGPRRGEVWWASMREPVGSEPGRRIRTVLVAAITGNLGLSEAPGNVTVEALESGLPGDSVVNVSQVATLAKDFLGNRVGSLGTRTMLAVDEGLRTALGL